MNTTIPWVLAVLSAAWFGLMARSAARNWVLWGLGGGVFALVASTIVFGLGNAASIPFSDHDLTVFHLKWAAISVVLIAVGGWLLTMSLHQHHISLWRLFNPATDPSAAVAGGSTAGRIESAPGGSKTIPKPTTSAGQTPGSTPGSGAPPR